MVRSSTFFARLNEFWNPLYWAICKNVFGMTSLQLPHHPKTSIAPLNRDSGFLYIPNIEIIRLQIKNDQKLNACDYDRNYHGQT